MQRSIVISGASSGIGSALAQYYARDGVLLGLLGRNQSRLRAIEEKCRRLGADTRIGLIDSRLRQETSRWLEAVDNERPIDLAIANAGVMSGRSSTSTIEDANDSHALLDTNVLGTLNFIQPLLPKMVERKVGQIAIISSIGAFIPLPDAPSYGASKAALLSYGLALRGLLDPHGVKVSVVCPVYVNTPMAEQESGAKPFAIDPTVAARTIAHGLALNKPIVAFPTFFSWMTRIGGLLPDRLRRWTQRPYRFTVEQRRADS